MRKLYFSYSLMAHQSLDGAEPRSAPYSISWNVGRFLRDRAQECGYAFEYVNLDDATPREFDATDIVIGHLWHEPGSTAGVSEGEPVDYQTLVSRLQEARNVNEARTHLGEVRTEYDAQVAALKEYVNRPGITADQAAR